MKLSDLKKIIPTAIAIIDAEDDLELVSICDLQAPLSNAVIFVKNKRYLNLVLEQRPKEIGFIICNKLTDLASELAILSPLFVLSTDKIDLSVSIVSKPFYDQKYLTADKFKADIDESATIHNGASIGNNVTIGENVIIHAGSVVMDNSSIGANSILFPNCTIYPFVTLGESTRIHAGTIIGADGFGYNFDGGIHHKVWHMGGVNIADNVEIGANSQIDGGTFSPTIIGEGSKLDNNVQIGHNCKLGKGVMICGHVAIGGSSTLGDYTVFGGKSGMGDNMILGMGCKVAGGALVNTDWPDGSVLGGHPARPLKEWMRGIAFDRKQSLRK